MKTFFKFPLVIIIAVLTATVILGIQMKNLVIDNDTTNFLPMDNPERMEYKKIEDTYGGGMIMAISITAKEGYIYEKPIWKKSLKSLMKWRKFPILPK
jgi:hypothetical protein